MAAGRFDALALQVGMMGAVLGGSELPPNPYRPEGDEPKKSPEQIKAESDVAWNLMIENLRKRVHEFRRDHPEQAKKARRQ